MVRTWEGVIQGSVVLKNRVVTIPWTVSRTAHDRRQPLPYPQNPATETVSDVRLDVLAMRVLTLGAVVAGMVLEYGLNTPPVSNRLIHLGQILLWGLYTLDVWVGGRFGRRGLREPGHDWVDAILGITAGVGVVIEMGALVGSHPRQWHLFELSVVLLVLGELWRINVGLSRRFRRPGLLLPVSFLTLIAIGTLLLKAPMAVPAGQSLSWLDALFTMTSAVCVTGLVVRDTATSFTPYGQAVIGLFIQLGGLGVIIFGSMLVSLLGHRLSLRQHMTLSKMLNDQPLNQVISLVRFIVGATLLIELGAAMALMTLWPEGLSFKQRFAMSLFHAVSAFCNAGFSLQNNSLESYRYAVQVHLILVPLIVIGGLGFPVLQDLWRVVGARRLRLGGRRGGGLRASDRLNLHTKVVLGTTAVLYLYGVFFLFVAQFQPYVYDYFQQGVTSHRRQVIPLSLDRLGGMLADASFLSVTSRTAGFHTVPVETLDGPGRFVILTLMMIGASPGGTGGGMKTTTLAILVLTIAATLRARQETEVFDRRIRDTLVRKAATIATCFIALATASTGLLCFSEPYSFEKVAFEAVSAASTTGLSLGITGDLTPFGKAVIIATMFLGRIGPLSLLVGLLMGSKPARAYAYPHEDVGIG